MAKRVNPEAVGSAVRALESWLTGDDTPAPDRASLAAAVRLTARALAATAPGASVEVRLPPFVAVQCIPGPRHTRGTPANVVETDARTWLLLATGLIDFDAATADGRLRVSGPRAGDVASLLPLLNLD